MLRKKSAAAAVASDTEGRAAYSKSAVSARSIRYSFAAATR